MNEDLFEFRQQFLQQGVVFSFCGQVTQEMTEVIGDAVRSHIQKEQGQSGQTNKVFSVFIEMVQNISHYAAVERTGGSTAEEKPNGVVVIGCNDNGYYVHCGNLIGHGERDRLEEKLSIIRGMSRDELKAYYREQRRRGPDESSMGAGLGFIEIARQATDLSYHFRPVNDDSVFFSIKVSV